MSVIPPQVENVFTTGSDVGWIVAVLAGAAIVGLLVAWSVHRLASHILPETVGSVPLHRVMLRRVQRPIRLLLPVMFVYAAMPGVRARMPQTLANLLGGGLYAAFVAAVAWLLIELMYAGEEAVAEQYETAGSDNLKARKIVTQVRILRQIATAVILILAVGLVLLQYEPFRRFGTGILASAGIVGIVVGIAAQSTLSDLIAGIQIAITQPIRVDDVVIVEGEFGWIEEITLTYVVVRVWDRRRIVMPITHFVNQPFQNWTRTSSDLIGSVFLHVDHRTPVDAVRSQLQDIAKASPHWDGEVCYLHVTDATEHTIELRAIASARDASTLWELRCEIREQLIRFLQAEHPRSLPRIRARLEDSASRAGTDQDRP